MTYNFDGKTVFKTNNRFWLNEQSYLLYNNETEEHWADVTDNYLTIGKTPSGCSPKRLYIKDQASCIDAQRDGSSTPQEKSITSYTTYAM